MIEQLIERHETELRRLRYLADGERVVHFWRHIALVTRCFAGRTSTLLCLRREIEDA